MPSVTHPLPSPEEQLNITRLWLRQCRKMHAKGKTTLYAQQLAANVMGYPAWELLELAHKHQKSLDALTAWYEDDGEVYGEGTGGHFFVGSYSAQEFQENNMPGFPVEDAWEQLLHEALLFTIDTGFSHLPGQRQFAKNMSLPMAIEVQPSRADLLVNINYLDLIQGRRGWWPPHKADEVVEEPDWQDADCYRIQVKGDTDWLTEDEFDDPGRRGELTARLLSENRLPRPQHMGRPLRLGPRSTYSGRERIAYFKGHWLPTPHHQIALVQDRLSWLGVDVSTRRAQSLVARVMGYPDWGQMLARRRVPSIPVQNEFTFVWSSRIVQEMRWDVPPVAAMEVLEQQYLALRLECSIFNDEGLAQTLENPQAWGGPLPGVLYWMDSGHSQKAPARLYFGWWQDAGLVVPPECFAETVEFVPDGTPFRLELKKRDWGHKVYDGPLAETVDLLKKRERGHKAHEARAVIELVEFLADAGRYPYGPRSTDAEFDNPFR